MIRRRLRRAALVCHLTASIVHAQGTTARLAGLVTDTSGGRIPGATVTLQNDATGVTFSMVSTDAGSYAFESVQLKRDERRRIEFLPPSHESGCPGGIQSADRQHHRGVRTQQRRPDFPTNTLTSATFGRVRNNLASSARQIMLGVKYYF